MSNKHSLAGPVLTVLSLLTGFVAGGGLIMAAGLKNATLANWCLSWDPRYSLAMDAATVLSKRTYSLRLGGGTRDVGIIKITDPSWGVILDFIQSEIAIRKSQRNLPVYPERSALATPSPENAPNSTNGNIKSNSVRDNEIMAIRMSTSVLDSEFQRAKTIISLRFDVAQAGDQPLAPPYRLMLVSPLAFPGEIATPSVYEFLSFREFRLDLRDMIIGELEAWSLWLAVIAFALSTLIGAIRLFGAGAERRRHIREVTAEITTKIPGLQLSSSP